MALYYKQRASAGLIISEATAISEEGYGWYGAPALYEPEHVQGWKKVTDAVHSAGGKFFLQLWHMGRQAHSSFHSSKDIVSASAIAVPGSSHLRSASHEQVHYEVPRALTIPQIQQTVQDYIRAAHMAKEAGADGIEIHAANGYLLDQFLQSCSNQRTDEYGGSVENRARFLFEVMDAVLASGVFPPSRVGIRLSPNGSFGGMGSADNKEQFLYVVQKLNKYKLGYLHFIDGLAFGFHNLCEPVSLGEVNKVYDGIVMAACGYTKEKAEGTIQSGGAALVAFGRPYLSNPDVVERFAVNAPLSPLLTFGHMYGDDGEQDGKTGKGYTDYPTYEQLQQDKADTLLKEKDGKASA